MNKIKTRWWLTVITVIAFFAPLAAVVAVEHAKNNAKLAEEQQNYLATLTASDTARAQYYQNIDVKKAELKKTMADAQAQYDALIKDQAAQIAAHTTTQSQTALQPVTVQKIIQPTSSSSSSTSKASAPKSSAKTKTS